MVIETAFCSSRSEVLVMTKWRKKLMKTSASGTGPSKGQSENVSDRISRRPIYWDWRRSKTRHLESLEVVKGRLVWRDGTKIENVSTKECRMKAVHDMWDNANDTVD